MTGDLWFSSALRLTVDVDTGSPREMLSVVVFTARDFERAFHRALDLGRAMETSYRNAANGRVRWRLAEVVTVDMLGGAIADGREVYCEPRSPRGTATANAVSPTTHKPEESQPTQSGV